MTKKFNLSMKSLVNGSETQRLKTLRSVSSLLLVLGISIAGAKASAEPISPKFYGDYLGLSFSSIENGGTFEESLISLIVDKNGLHRTQFVDKYSFHVTYSSEWLIDVRDSETLSGWFPERTYGNRELLAIRQSPQSDLAQRILEHIPKYSFRRLEFRLKNLLRGRLTDLDMIENLGEGIPATLGVFTKKDKKEKAERRLKNAYEFYKRALAKGAPDERGRSWVHPIDLSEDLRDLADPKISINSKFEILRNAQYGMATGTPEEIAERVAVLDFAITKSNEPLLISGGLTTAKVGARVGAMAAIVASALEASLDRFARGSLYWNEHEIIEEAVGASAVQLFEAHRLLGAAAQIQKRFGTTDIKTIHATTLGRISAEDANLLNEFVEAQVANAKRGYSLEDVDRLTAALEKVKSFPGFPDKPFLGTALDVEKALRDYPQSQLCSLRLGGQSL